VIDPDATLELWRRADGPMRLRVMTGSMAPTLSVGDMVEVDRNVRPRMGDVVLLSRGDRFVVHRVVCTWPRLRTRGDAALRADRPVTREAIAGVVTAVWRNGERYRLPGYPWSTAYALVSTIEKTSLLGLRFILLASLRTPCRPLTRRTLMLTSRGRSLVYAGEHAGTTRRDGAGA
jgi:hypothetical protein